VKERLKAERTERDLFHDDGFVFSGRHLNHNIGKLHAEREGKTMAGVRAETWTEHRHTHTQREREREEQR